MYFLIVVLLMFVFPLVSIIVELLSGSSSSYVFLVGKWFVFWAAGIRLFTAGLRQILQPQFTANKIIGVNDESSLIFVKELGFANSSIGLLGILTIFFIQWITPGAIAGGLFLGLAGINHVFRKGKNNLEKVVTFTNLFVFFVLIVFVFSNTI